MDQKQTVTKEQIENREASENRKKPKKNMSKTKRIIRTVVKTILVLLAIGFTCNLVLKTISYSFYKDAKELQEVSATPEFIQMTEALTGYGYHLEEDTDQVILFFGGSNDIAYNAVGKYAAQFQDPFIAVDYYGTQQSGGKMNLSTMKLSATGVYTWAQKKYPGKDIVIMGHSFGTGMATYLASEKQCHCLILAAGYRDLSDLYNKMVPIFWGPVKLLISNNIQTADYAKKVKCPVYILGSKADKKLSADLQNKLAAEFDTATVKIFDSVPHENYYSSKEVLEYIDSILY